MTTEKKSGDLVEGDVIELLGKSGWWRVTKTRTHPQNRDYIIICAENVETGEKDAIRPPKFVPRRVQSL